ncbi:copper resistance protein CopD [Duganella sp. BJB488]|uniref:CopD family protein n=1 Tax=unclassified Duganella TaxID=2636909 RepID=UPI000E34ADCC|nr:MULTISPECIES: CopD family protein [unclassified Duganella]RFP17546.1 copper resistance protein CopD [Duganella sp. BJB489]RFP22057.1 copper resistance protein CopD [Duganella sp. BJB488]RFP37390.1 copper resistance protein CopD [Duganella sp. BJB480]
MGAGFDTVWLVQVGSAFALICGFCWLVGSWSARRWLPRDDVMSAALDARLRVFDLLAVGIAIVAGGWSLLAATAVMAGCTMRQACDMFWMMVSGTAYGHASCLALMALVVVLVLRCIPRLPMAGETAVLLALGVFALTRASMGHAGEEGIWTLPYAAEAVHLSAISVWTGVVAVSGWCVLSARLPPAATNRYLDLMSHTALVAVVAIGATGVYSGWHRVGSTGNLMNTVYGFTLLVKVALVAVAVGIGGYNKFIGLPAASRSLKGVAVVRLALRIETVLLLGAVLAAAILTSQQPPTAL